MPPHAVEEPLNCTKTILVLPIVILLFVQVYAMSDHTVPSETNTEACTSSAPVSASVDLVGDHEAFTV